MSSRNLQFRELKKKEKSFFKSQKTSLRACLLAFKGFDLYLSSTLKGWFFKVEER
jgi:hypothetical protein